MKDKHVVPRENGWDVKTAGKKKASRVFSNRGEALDYAHHIATKHQACMVIHDDQGKFENRECNLEHTNQHVVPDEEGWIVIDAKNRMKEEFFDNKRKAKAYAYQKAKENKVCVMVHKQDGKFEKMKCPSEGKEGVIEFFKNEKGIY